MKTLTIRSPWAHLVCLGVKDVENRSWSTPYRGRLAIHAGRRVEQEGYELAESLGIAVPEIQTGVILGYVSLVDVVTDSQSPWAQPGLYHWILKDATAFREPIPATGKMGLWSAETATTDELLTA